MKKPRLFFITLILFALLICSNILFANAAAPGFYHAGGNGEFVPFFASDSSNLSKIQMQSEVITVLLYPNFAVVRGEYNMLNLSNEKISFNTGYPINSQFDNEEVSSISFEDIYNLKVSVDGKQVSTEKMKGDESSFDTDARKRNLYNNWYVWKSDFAPKSVTKIKVYFIVNTSNSLLRKGYSKDDDNGFVYILESGKPWAKNIESGRINLQLMDGLKAAAIMGISPQKWTINEEGNSLIYDFKNLEPETADNVVVRYKRTDAKFDFSQIISGSQKYFDEIDRIQPANIFAESYKPFIASDFKVHNTSGETWIGILFFFGIFEIPVLTIVVITIIIFVIIRRKKRRKQELTS